MTRVEVVVLVLAVVISPTTMRTMRVYARMQLSDHVSVVVPALIFVVTPARRESCRQWPQACHRKDVRKMKRQTKDGGIEDPTSNQPPYEEKLVSMHDY